MPMFYQTPDQHPLYQLRFWQQLLEQQQWEQEERRRLDRRRTQTLAAPDRRRSAEHEATHAVASLAMGGRVGEIAITGDGGGYFRAAVSQRPPVPPRSRPRRFVTSSTA
jgi:hypothetical protein